MNVVLPLEAHWAIASSRVVPVSNGIPVYWERLVWRSVGHVTSQYATPDIYNWYGERVVWSKLISFVLQPQIHRSYDCAYVKSMHRVMLKYSYFEEQNRYALESSKLQVKAEFTETCPLAAWGSIILSFQTGMDATLLNDMCLCVWAVPMGVPMYAAIVRVSPVVFQCGVVSAKFFQRCSSVLCKYSLGGPVIP